ncbi:ATP-binding protein [Sulfurovum sp. NBC37-1]|uniref:ATP-binding protein n=1 Tax=Sulfurovum sp. (strain NBC37-1) TaxID=387093 RepID=UPI0013051D88|nr:ATP-binding protein [Sulfurovum sp. NBC37-1]
MTYLVADQSIPSNTKINFTQDEQDYLSKKKEVIVCDYGEWMPYIGHDETHTFGILYDFYKVFASKIGVPMRFVHKPDMEACVTMVTEGEADAVVSLGTPNTFSDIALSHEYGNDFVALVTQLQTPFIRDMKVLNGKAVGIIGHYKNMIAYLHNTYPSLQLQKVDSTADGLAQVAKGELYAFIDIYRIAAYTIRREHVGELKINTKVYPLVMRAHVGLRKEDVLLKSIFNKAIDNLSTAEKTRMIGHWMRAEKVVKPDYRLLIEIVTGALLLLLGFLYYHLKVRYRQKALLEKQAKLAGMGSMISNIAHQWRQPLSRINSNITVMKMLLDSNEAQKEQLTEKLNSIEENTQYMSDTIEDFLHFFHPNKQKTSVLLQACVEKALHLTGIYSKNIKVSINANKESWVYTYEKELIQVILIILNNAMDNFKIKSTSDPKIEISVESHQGKALLSIRDNGGGIEEKEIDRIFEPYYTTKFKHEGTGLGLYMAKLLTENSMGGSLRVKNVKGGALFEIALPKGENKDA